MRILRVAQKVYPDVEGGAPYHVHAMSRDQAAMGHDVHVLTLTDGDEQESVRTDDGYTLHREPIDASPLGNDVSWGVWKQLRSATDFDVIHAHSHLYFSSNLAALHRRLDDVPLVLTNHGIYSQNAPKRLFELYLRTAGLWTFNQADLIFCYTEEGKERAQELGIDTEIEIVSNGIDHTRFTPDGPRHDGISPDSFTVVSPIRLVEGKRPFDVLEAVERLHEAHPSIELYLCGDGPLRAELETYVESNGLSDVVSFPGMVPYDEMPNVYRSADLVVLPSEAEAGSPRVLLEGMSTEKPFITPNLPQIATQLKELGGTVDVGDIDGLAREIERFIEDDELRESIGKRGRELVLEEYNWMKTVEETTAATERVVEAFDGG